MPKLARAGCLLFALCGLAFAQGGRALKPVPEGPRGAYLSQVRLQSRALATFPAPLPGAFEAVFVPQPAARTPAAFAARFALVDALASPQGLRPLIEAVASHEGPKGSGAARALERLERALAAASNGERRDLALRAQALRARFDGATAAPGESVDMASLPTNEPGGPGRKETRRRMKKDRGRLLKLQEMLAAGKLRGVLVVLQGPDAAGKGGAIKRPLRLNPSWLRVAAFKKPTPEEASRPYLERIEAAFPKGGPIGVVQILDRSHYEDIVMPTLLGSHPAEEIESRYGRNLAFERRLAESGVALIKLFLHVSHREQGRRLRERVARPSKRWKASRSDWEMRARFGKSLAAWGEVLARTSPAWALWRVVASDHKPRRDAEVARIVLKTLRRMKLAWPENPEAAELGRLRPR